MYCQRREAAGPAAGGLRGRACKQLLSRPILALIREVDDARLAQVRAAAWGERHRSALCFSGESCLFAEGGRSPGHARSTRMHTHSIRTQVVQETERAAEALRRAGAEDMEGMEEEGEEEQRQQVRVRVKSDGGSEGRG